ncbi:MAG: Crp/Fnr family transcriptional regulator [Sphingomonadaceae bacterium]|nr:Crp/Fnr family transcriptional regulator [Sphingomonadaceae bacterium]
MPNPFVQKLGRYASLSDEDTRLLESACRDTRRTAARRDLIREGDPPGPVFVMLEGWACRYKLMREGGRQVLALLMPGDFCDMHVAVLDEMDHSIGTLTPALYTEIPRERMETLIASSPALTRAFWIAQLVDEGVLRAWIVSMGRRDSTERLAHLMCELYIRARNVGLCIDGHCEMPLTQIVIADALGLTPVHVNRVLRKLKVAGAMELGRGTLHIRDVESLARIAGFDDNYLHRRLKLAA